MICEEEKRETLENIIFTETTTIGIRRCQMERTVMKREFATITTEYGDAAVKICRHGEIEKFTRSTRVPHSLLKKRYAGW